MVLVLIAVGIIILLVVLVALPLLVVELILWGIVAATLWLAWKVLVLIEEILTYPVRVLINKTRK